MHTLFRSSYAGVTKRSRSPLCFSDLPSAFPRFVRRGPPNYCGLWVPLWMNFPFGGLRSSFNHTQPLVNRHPHKFLFTFFLERRRLLQQCCQIGDFLNLDCYQNYNTVILNLEFYRFERLFFFFSKIVVVIWIKIIPNLAILCCKHRSNMAVTRLLLPCPF